MNAEKPSHFAEHLYGTQHGARMMTYPRPFGRILMTVAVLLASALPILVDISESHVLNPAWPPHARVHEVWLLSTGASVGAVALGLIWIRPQLVLAAVLTACILGGFLVAAATAPLYGGVLVDPATAHLMPNNDRIFGIPAKVPPLSA